MGKEGGIANMTELLGGTRSASPRVIAVAGGRDASGKSLCAAYLAASLARRDLRVVVVDCDRSSVPLAALLGMGTTQPGEWVEPAEAAPPMRRSAIPGLSLVQAAREIARAGPRVPLLHRSLDASLRAIPADAIVLDIGPDGHPHALDLFNLADQRILVTTAQFLSIQYTFTFLKAAIQRLVRSCALTSAQRALFEQECTPSEADTLPDILLRLGARDPSYLARVKGRLGRYSCRVMGNLVMEEREVNVLHAVARMMRHYLNIPLPVAGSLKASLRLFDATRPNPPLMNPQPDKDNGWRMDAILDQLLREPLAERARSGSSARADAEADFSDEELEDDDAGDGDAMQDVAITVVEEGAPHIAEPVSISPFQRRSERRPIDMGARFERNGQEFAGRVVELSEHGAAICSDAPLQVGMWIRAYFEALPQEPISYEVRSVRADGEFGLEVVDAPLDPARVAAWLLQFPARADAVDATAGA